jgi:hypothetical protein
MNVTTAIVIAQEIVINELIRIAFLVIYDLCLLTRIRLYDYFIIRGIFVRGAFVQGAFARFFCPVPVNIGNKVYVLHTIFRLSCPYP